MRFAMRYLPALLLTAFTTNSFATGAQSYPFEWAQGSLIPGTPKERVAILLPIKVNGINCSAQLDTGASSQIYWRSKASTDQNEEAINVLVEVGPISTHLKAKPSNLVKLQEKECSNIATLGNGFFENGSLTLDLKRSQFTYSTDAILAENKNAQPLIYAQWKGESAGHTLVEVRVPSGKLGYALLDTGATAFGLNATSPAEWADLTGALPVQASANVEEFKVGSWGKQINCYKAKIKGPMSIGKMLTLSEYQVSYCVLDAFVPGQKVLGVLGLKHFGDNTITLDYLSRRWIVKSD